MRPDGEAWLAALTAREAASQKCLRRRFNGVEVVATVLPSHRAPTMASLTSYDIAKTVRDLLVIARVAMPPHLYGQDPRVLAGLKLLDTLNASQHRPPSVPSTHSEELPFLGTADPQDPWARRILDGLNAFPHPDIQVSKGIDAFLAEADSPRTRPAAIEHILRDWLIGHGYIHESADENPYH